MALWTTKINVDMLKIFLAYYVMNQHQSKRKWKAKEIARTIFTWTKPRACFPVGSLIISGHQALNLCCPGHLFNLALIITEINLLLKLK